MRDLKSNRRKIKSLNNNLNGDKKWKKVIGKH
jgi:hypothetical protein